MEAPRRHGREVRTRLVIDRIVSDKTFWNATFSRGFFQKIFREVSFHKANNAFKQFETIAALLLAVISDTALPSMLLIPAETRWIHFFSGRSLAERAAVLS